MVSKRRTFDQEVPLRTFMFPADQHRRKKNQGNGKAQAGTSCFLANYWSSICLHAHVQRPPVVVQVVVLPPLPQGSRVTTSSNTSPRS